MKGLPEFPFNLKFFEKELGWVDKNIDVLSFEQFKKKKYDELRLKPYKIEQKPLYYIKDFPNIGRGNASSHSQTGVRSRNRKFNTLINTNKFSTFVDIKIYSGLNNGQRNTQQFNPKTRNFSVSHMIEDAESKTIEVLRRKQTKSMCK